MALRVGTALATAALLALAPAAASATTVDDVEVSNEVGDGNQESGDKGLWGLLGLLGLFAPLFNKRNDDVTVNRTTTTTTGRNDGNPLT